MKKVIEVVVASFVCGVTAIVFILASALILYCCNMYFSDITIPVRVMVAAANIPGFFYIFRKEKYDKKTKIFMGMAQLFLFCIILSIFSAMYK